jgi:predicted extracellular nuclease
MQFSMSQTYSIAFYNLENLFDPLDNENTRDKDYTPEGIFKWDREKYFQKIEHLSKVISKVGKMRSNIPPVLMGVCEVENELCLKDLIESHHLKKYEYDWVFDSSADSRGINVALLYQKKHFKILGQKAYTLALNIEGQIENSRNILHITGTLFDEKIHLIINHWPSRTDGTKKTNYKRKVASNTVQQIIDKIYFDEPSAHIMIMGDFNDDPLSDSLQPFKSLDFMNAMEQFHKEEKGSVKYKGKWIMFDQILLSQNLLKASWFNYQQAHIFVEPFLIQKTGRFKGSPKRTFINKYHQGGYSDHFPVFIYFETALQV